MLWQPETMWIHTADNDCFVHVSHASLVTQSCVVTQNQFTEVFLCEITSLNVSRVTADERGHEASGNEGNQLSLNVSLWPQQGFISCRQSVTLALWLIESIFEVEWSSCFTLCLFTSAKIHDFITICHWIHMQLQKTHGEHSFYWNSVKLLTFFSLILSGSSAIMPLWRLLWSW